MTDSPERVIQAAYEKAQKEALRQINIQQRGKKILKGQRRRIKRIPWKDAGSAT